MQTGQSIAELRKAAGMTQEQLAEKLFVSRDLVSKWETGQRRPDYRTVCRLADLLQADPDAILSRADLLLSELADCIPPGLSADAAALTEALNGFLGTLSLRDRSVFIRRYYYWEEPAQIAEAAGIGSGYVRVLLMRTRRKLKAYLKGVSA